MAKINIPRCLAAMKNIEVSGSPTTSQRLAKLEEAIALIQADGVTALADGYLGVKNYAGFGDQECNCSYGCGPRHGSIVFEVGRVRNNLSAKLGADEVYLLECVRDFGVLDEDNEDPARRNNETRRMNLCGVLQRIKTLADVRELYSAKVEAVNVDTH